MGRRRFRAEFALAAILGLALVAPVVAVAEQGVGPVTPGILPSVGLAAAELQDNAEVPLSDGGSEWSLLGAKRRADPISINSEELEVVPLDGGRRLVFSRNVEVVQGEVTLKADRLEALYPEGASQPAELLAFGHVRVAQGDKRALCDEAVYERGAQTIVCRGEAEVLQGCDRLRGSEIEFDLERERVRVTGAASVVIRPEDAEGGDCVHVKGQSR